MKTKALAPIVLFVYSRPKHTKKVIEALKENELAKESNLFIFSDGPKNKDVEKDVLEVRNYLKTITGFKSVKVFESKINKGLANSIIYGVTKIVNKYGKIIVLEDDIVTSKYFLKFMNDSLNLYENEEKVISISGYTYPIDNLPQTFFLKNAECWGWATWKRGWSLFEKNGEKMLEKIKNKELNNQFDFNNSYPYSKMLVDQVNGKNNSWAIRWYASAFLKNKLTLYPAKSFVQNIGVDGSGTNGGKLNVYYTKPEQNYFVLKRIIAKEDKQIRKKFSAYFKKINSFYYKIFLFIKNLFY